jgi:hypothetical protein
MEQAQRLTVRSSWNNDDDDDDDDENYVNLKLHNSKLCECRKRCIEDYILIFAYTYLCLLQTY